MQCFFFYSLSAIILKVPLKSGSGNWHFFPCQMQISHLPSVNIQSSLTGFFFLNKIRAHLAKQSDLIHAGSTCYQLEVVTTK